MPPILNPDFETVRRNKVYEEVARQIERLILKKLQPGDKLPSERELAETLQVSRSSIRDAIRSLELMGMVEPRQGTGTIVKEISTDCDMDTVLVKVEALGPGVCHEGYESCFFRRLSDGHWIENEPRAFDPAAVYGGQP